MRTELFDYELPPDRIAQRPTAERDGARLLVVNGGATQHRTMKEWPDLVPEGALVVLNDSKVIKARLLCRREGGGGKAELLLLNPVVQQMMGESAEASAVWLALGRANRPLREGTVLEVGEARVRVMARLDEGFLHVALDYPAGISALLERWGQVPLPPYVERPADALDEERYQTVFAAHEGSVAAPTAGLHLTAALLRRLQERAVQLGHVTLHVGVGTFRPVSAADLDQHVMHTEGFEISPHLAAQVNTARETGAAIVAVGTTVVRALESAAVAGEFKAQRGTTRLLIQPGYRFSVVNALLTNFHAPRSTLLALVSAFAGTPVIRSAYREALSSGYRFLSYGDAMWIPQRAVAEAP